MSFEINVVPNKGDIIRVKRKLGYYHYGIYIGKDTVIHYSADHSDSIFDNSNIMIQKTNLQTGFLRGDVLEVNIPYDSYYFRFVVCHRAKKYLGQHNFRGFEYDVLKNNCEHFANYCYYGEAISSQSDYASAGVLGVLSSLGVRIFNRIGKNYKDKKIKKMKKKKGDIKC